MGCTPPSVVTLFLDYPIFEGNFHHVAISGEVFIMRMNNSVYWAIELYIEALYVFASLNSDEMRL